MATNISGITPSFYQDIYPAAYQSATGQYPTSGSAGTALPGQKAASGDEAKFSAEGVEQSKKGDGKPEGGKQLSDTEQKQVDELKQTDQRVRTHEQAHLAAGGGLAKGGATFEYKTGPDGKQYAVGGEVQIDTSAEKDPNATIRKAERIKRAALAPADPSAQDRSVAASADAMAAKARQELNQSQSGGGGSGGGDKGGGAMGSGQAGVKPSTAGGNEQGNAAQQAGNAAYSQARQAYSAGAANSSAVGGRLSKTAQIADLIA